MQNTGEKTQGDWVSLTIDHGKAPQNASYEYAILPCTKQAEMSAFAKKPSYKVLQKDRNAHIVRDLKSNTTSYVLFELGCYRSVVACSDRVYPVFFIFFIVFLRI